MTIRQVALEIKKWAQANNMIDISKAVPEVDLALIRGIFKGTGLLAATAVLQDKGISHIGINEGKSQIMIFTRKKLSVKDRKTLESIAPSDATGKISVVFRQASIAHAGPSAVPPIGVPPYEMYKDKYTCGSSVYIGSEKGAGTFGCLVRDLADGTMYGLSNNHVTGGSSYAAPGLPIIAPGSLDITAGGMDPTTLGHHEEAYPFVDGLPDIVDSEKNLDAAIFRISDTNFVSSMQRSSYDTPSDCIPMECNMVVTKTGRTTGRTSGNVVTEYFDFEPVEYRLEIIGGKKIVYFQSLFGIIGTTQPFAQQGDSGALIITTVDGIDKAVGIIVAVDDNGLTFAISLHRVLDYFKIELVSGHNI